MNIKVAAFTVTQKLYYNFLIYDPILQVYVLLPYFQFTLSPSGQDFCRLLSRLLINFGSQLRLRSDYDQTAPFDQGSKYI